MAVFSQTHRSESLPARIALTIIQNGNAAMASKTAIARRHGLPALQASLLIHLHNSNGGPCTVGALADAMQLTPPTISDSLKALVRKGCLSRKKSSEDGRVVLFRCTQKGRRLADRLAGWANPIEKTVADLKEDQQQSFMGALTHLLRDQVEGGYFPSEAMCASCEHFEPISWDRHRYRCSRRDIPLTPVTLHTDCSGHHPFRNGKG